TVVVDHLGAAYRDEDPVPVDLALDHGYPGIIIAWLDGRDGRPAAGLHEEVSRRILPEVLSGSPIEIASSWTPTTPSEEASTGGPMPLGSPAGGPNRLLQIFFVGGELTPALEAVRAYTDAVEREGLADTQLVAPFYRTTPGRDTYLDQLW
ncbi:MAG: hypothetical protein KGQ66_22135, partial [Acidobacteriota bacterium]|nr:hypothetical protein [Acidobacteriota bacterium]